MKKKMEFNENDVQHYDMGAQMMCQVFMLKVHNVFLNKLNKQSLCV